MTEGFYVTEYTGVPSWHRNPVQPHKVSGCTCVEACIRVGREDLGGVFFRLGKHHSEASHSPVSL